MSGKLTKPMSLFDGLFDGLLGNDLEEILGPLGIKVTLPALPDQIKVTMSEDDDNVYFRAVVPGFKKDELNVSIRNDTVILSGKSETTSEKEALFSSENVSFEHKYAIPSNVRVKEISSELNAGILVVTFPKVPQTARDLSVREIPITSSEE